MINKITLCNFKCFRRCELDLGSLTVLAGLNGMGKSSVIHALLILRQSFLSGELQAGNLLLAGDLVDLGTGVDVLFEDATEELITLGYSQQSEDSESSSLLLSYRYDRESERLRLSDNEPMSRDRLVLNAFAESGPFGSGFWYLQAERVGPRKSLPMSEAHVQRRDLGTRGEFVLHFLLSSAEVVLSEADPRLRSHTSRRLTDQVDSWLQEISPGSHLDIEAVRSADIAIGGYRFSRPGDVSSRRFRSTNVGFGLSYSLPIIVALLASRPGELVLIENPEAHIHPRGQTQLGSLCALASAAGVQVLAETHSDHFVDGIRIAVRARRLPPDACRFHYFEKREGESVVDSPAIDEDGRLSFWPEGFFDQHDENLVALLAPRDSA
jgi:predicted ATPase